MLKTLGLKNLNLLVRFCFKSKQFIWVLTEILTFIIVKITITMLKPFNRHIYYIVQIY